MIGMCGSFQVNSVGEFQDYSDLESHVCKSGTDGILIGEDASDFMSFHAIEIRKAFTDEKFRVGIILDNRRGSPVVCSIHAKSVLAIGMNNSVQFVNLNSRSVIASSDLGCCMHHILCNGKFLAAIHELGAVVIELSEFREVAEANCDVVADATLTDDALLLVSMDEQSTRIDLTGTGQT